MTKKKPITLIDAVKAGIDAHEKTVMSKKEAITMLKIASKKFKEEQEDRTSRDLKKAIDTIKERAETGFCSCCVMIGNENDRYSVKYKLSRLGFSCKDHEDKKFIYVTWGGK